MTDKLLVFMGDGTESGRKGSTETARERGVVRKRARDMEEGGWGLGKGGERDGERETERRG